MATNYNINYEDEKFQQVEADKQTAINEMNNTYNQMIGQTDKYYQDQINATKDYASTQQQLQQQNTDFAIEQIEQQKTQAQKDYTKEQSGAYVDWQKQSNQYGANAEQMAANGLQNTGYSESSQVSMYNQYQSRVATARESYNKAVLNYDNAIKDAQLQNNSKLAEIAYQALQAQLELSLQGFQYKNQLILDQVAQKQQLENTYYGRYQDVLNQMNTENAMAEQIRQYNQNYAQQIKEYQEGIRQFDTQIAYYKEKDAREYELKIKQLEEEKRQFEATQKLKQQEMAQSQAQWQAEYNLARQKATQQSQQITKTPTVQQTKTKEAEKTYTANRSAILHNNAAMKYVDDNISKVVIKNGGITETALVSALEKGKKAGKLNDSDIDKVLKTFGL